MTQDTKSAIDPAATPMFIGCGVEFEGTIRHRGPENEKAVVLGTLKGDVEWNGILQVPKGGKVLIERSLRVREMIVGGEVAGANDQVVVETGLLRVGESGVIDVAMVRLPTGGLEQARGSVINAQLSMAKDHPFALQAPADGNPGALRLVSGLEAAAAGLAALPGTLTPQDSNGSDAQGGHDADAAADAEPGGGKPVALSDGDEALALIQVETAGRRLA